MGLPRRKYLTTGGCISTVNIELCIKGGLTLIVPAAHAKADVEDGPLPELRGKVILLLGIGD